MTRIGYDISHGVLSRRNGRENIIPDPGHLFPTSKYRHIVLGFVDISYLVLSTYQTGEGATGQGLGLGVFGGMLAWVPGSGEGGGGAMWCG